MTRARASWMVFTALDGSLLDPQSRSFEAARASLRRLITTGIPVVPVTGKTFAEVRLLADVLGIEGPIVIESGGGIARRVGSSWRLEACGAETKELREAVPVIEQRSGARLRLYSAMRLDEAAAAAGLPEARIAPAAGPAGWAKAIDEIAGSLTRHEGSP